MRLLMTHVLLLLATSEITQSLYSRVARGAWRGTGCPPHVGRLSVRVWTRTARLSIYTPLTGAALRPYPTAFGVCNR